MLGRHALLWRAPRRCMSAREMASAQGMLGLSGSPFDLLLDLREGKARRGPRERRYWLFAEYLEFIRELIEFVGPAAGGATYGGWNASGWNTSEEKS